MIFTTCCDPEQANCSENCVFAVLTVTQPKSTYSVQFIFICFSSAFVFVAS